MSSFTAPNAGQCFTHPRSTAVQLDCEGTVGEGNRPVHIILHLCKHSLTGIAGDEGGAGDIKVSQHWGLAELRFEGVH